MWNNYIDTFSKKIRITIDLLGHGETECAGYIHSMEDNADAVHYSLGADQAILVGHPMGGYVAGFRQLYPKM
jgi:pimeloyl-ACP methyl ester carboxylesterase